MLFDVDVHATVESYPALGADGEVRQVEVAGPKPVADDLALALPGVLALGVRAVPP